MKDNGWSAGGKGDDEPRHRADGKALDAVSPGATTTFNGAGQGLFVGLLTSLMCHWAWGANLLLIPLAYGYGLSRLRSWPELAGLLTMLGTTVAYFSVYDVVAIDGLGPWTTLALVGLVVVAFVVYAAVVGDRVEASRLRALARAGSHPERVEQSQQWEDRYFERLRGPEGLDVRGARRWFRWWMLRAAAALIVWLWLMWVSDSRALPALVVSVLVFHVVVFRRVVRYHQRLTQDGAGLVVGRSTRRPVLFLRPFALDALPLSPMESRWSLLKIFSWFDKRSFEEYLHDSFSDLGPMVAIGRPGEQLAVLGAAREYADDESWRDLVLTRAQEARLVVMELDASPGMRWELDNVTRVVGLQRIVVVLPPEMDDIGSRSSAWYQRWQELREAHAFLPEVSGKSAAVVFADDSSSVVVRERATVAATLDEVMATWLRLRKDDPDTGSWTTTDLREGSEAATVGSVRSVADEPARRRLRKELARSEAVLSGLATRRTIRHGRDDLEALRHRHDLAKVYVAQGRMERAQTLLEEVVSRRTRVEGADAALTLAALGDLAAIQRLRGDIPGFLATAQRVADGCVRTLGEGDPQTFAARMQLGFALQETGQLEPARVLLRGLLDSPAANVVEPDVRRRAERVLGSVLTSAGEFAAARELLAAALDEAVSTVGVEHPDTSETRGMLAEAHAGLGEIDEAASLAREALAGAEAFYGPTHALTLKYLVNAARHTADAGDEETARQLAERAVTTTRATLGPAHPDTLTALSVLGRARRVAGQSEPAVDLFLLAWKGRSQVLGPHHPHTLAALASAADAQRAAGRAEAALSNLRSAVDGYLESLGPDHPHTQAARAELARWERAMDVS